MAIIETVAAGEALSQGDILQGVCLFVTKESWKAGGHAHEIDRELCLVISRPCVTAHKDFVTAVRVEQISGGIPKDVDCECLDEVLDFLSVQRDGAESPDVFYLGDIAGKTGRFGARLDSLHSIHIPRDIDERQEFLARCRVGKLSHDFARDLHVRLFRAFASLGFDDIGWFSDEDLTLVLNAGYAELATAEGEQRKQAAAQSKIKYSGKTGIPQKERDAAEGRVKEIKQRLQPFEAEKKRRDDLAGGQSAITSPVNTPPS